ncbi:SDR family oxidoreductase [Agriterribacter sp.]|uniref:SDR family NAD(P)-dependent oxidoreductase n=1 Tax=Agriterribacter sp. TaxID=2821509 RepID=UPI002CB9D2F3|nr:SDR family oxidoreductase [Agriterribacter sp.]HRO44799.1 SDR family oxidoreductase [Agriterribacter sp.]HRQ18116.1 SDR family oxidoreductase [Agriterribacter sp.]
MDLHNKVALITGGTHGIGAETAIALAAQGAHIALVARHTGDGTVRKKIEAMGIPCITVTADLSKEEECTRAINEVQMHYGSIDILVHSAGAPAPGSLLNGAREIWYQAFDIHVHAIFHLCRAAVPCMKANKKGAIVLISSAAGIRGVKNALAYAVVKGAIPQFCRALALELSPDNITVNCVSPGVIRTRFQDFLTPEQVKNNISNRIPLQREGTPEDVAAVICTLVKNRFITGENIVIDGGMTMRIV